MAILDTLNTLFNGKRTAITAAPSIRKSYIYNTDTGQFEELKTVTSIVLDASINEVHSTTATVTSHPVESGADFTDHVHKEPDTINIEGLISNTSTVFPQALPGAGLAQSVNSLITGEDQAKKAYEALKDIVDSRKLVTITTSLRTYENMLIDNLTVTRNADYANALYFTCSARELRIVNVGTVTIEEPKNGRLTSKKATGKKTTQPLSETVETKVTDKATGQAQTLGADIYENPSDRFKAFLGGGG